MLITEKAGCYCGNISADVVLSKPLSEFVPRACDCDFCTKHGAVYLSDSKGSLVFQIRDAAKLISFAQGDGIAEFLICGVCAVLVGGTCSRDGRLMGTLNSTTLANRDALQAPQAASPRLLSKSAKLDRWEELWFKGVTIVKSNA